MVASSDDDAAWFDPKWFVIGVAFAAFALIITYDLRLGIVAGIVLGIIAALWLYVAFRFGSLRRGPPSERKVMVQRFRQQAKNRRVAAARMAQPAPAPVTQPSAELDERL